MAANRYSSSRAPSGRGLSGAVDFAEGFTKMQNCPKCGKQAAWSYPDPDQSRVAVDCATCGRFQMSRDECHQALEQMEDQNIHDRTPG
jgi:endogenous inhibitor of DNA gyrase (YacG/DUF329 family)